MTEDIADVKFTSGSADTTPGFDIRLPMVAFGVGLMAVFIATLIVQSFRASQRGNWNAVHDRLHRIEERLRSDAGNKEQPDEPRFSAPGCGEDCVSGHTYKYGCMLNKVGKDETEAV